MQLPLKTIILLLVVSCWSALATAQHVDSKPLQISGIYPHLACFNGDRECGIGAVVPWAGRLWWITYPPHARHGSSDKLYSIGPDLELTIHSESVGGTHANRLIHRESRQLFIGPYVIDERASVRAFDVRRQLPGRLTATARHLTDPANKVYHVDMEGSVWEADVHTLQAKKLFEKPLPGWHGKGAYVAQGLLVVANNGEHPSLADLDESKITADLAATSPEDAGVLGTFNGRRWNVVLRRQFTDVTGPDGIRGNQSESDPLWAIGWDKRSVLLELLDGGHWHTFRVPKASHTFDPRHGWYTEWPRIRQVAPDRLLMVMHGTMFDFPSTFSAADTSGIRPICTHLRYIPDFCGWEGKLVLAADDTSIMQNPMAGQSQSNLWFGRFERLRMFGPACGWGGVWLNDAVQENAPSDPFLFAGYSRRTLHLAHEEAEPVKFTLEFDFEGDARWKVGRSITVGPHGYAHWEFPADTSGQWIRLRTNRNCSSVSAYFHYSGNRPADADEAASFASLAALAGVDDAHPWTGGLVRPAGHNRNLQFLCRAVAADGTVGLQHLWEIDETMKFHRVSSQWQAEQVRQTCAVDTEFTVDAASVVLSDQETGHRFRLPKGYRTRDEPSALGPVRTIREVVSERSLANIHGTFYEIPRAENSKGQLDYRRLKPVASHDKLITDFCTWRGLLVLAGCRAGASGDGHHFSAGADGPGLWFGMVDDLWRLGKPVGIGGPWCKTPVEPGEPSDPYLMTNYDRKTLTLRHDADQTVAIRVEVDFTNRNQWKEYKTFEVPPGQELRYVFPAGYAAHWLRCVADKPCRATATLEYW